jgi:hypothetical protein
MPAHLIMERLEALQSINAPQRTLAYYQLDGGEVRITMPVGAIGPGGEVYVKDAPPLEKKTLSRVTNAYHKDGATVEQWTASRDGDGVVLVNDLTGAVHKLPKAAVEAVMVLRSQ